MNGLRTYDHPTHLLISNKDLTGMEFFEHFKKNPDMVDLEKRGVIEIHNISESDHTFSNSKVKSQLFDIIYNVIEKIRTTYKYETTA
jgi:hypothetical protein